jgi:PRTRC genetic system protein E
MAIRNNSENLKMFKQLQALLKNGGSINMLIAGNKDGTLSVTVLPKPSKTGDDTAALSTPLSLTATADELDAEFVTLLSNYVGSHESLAEQIENTNAILEAAKKESQKKATTSISKSSTAKPAAVSAADVTSGSEGGGEDEDDENGQSESTGSTDNSQPAATVAAEPASLWG